MCNIKLNSFVAFLNANFFQLKLRVLLTRCHNNYPSFEFCNFVMYSLLSQHIYNYVSVCWLLRYILIIDVVWLSFENVVHIFWMLYGQRIDFSNNLLNYSFKT